MPSPTYPAARIVAPKIHSHFVRQVADAAQRGEEDVASVPDLETIESLIEAAFWASLRREESYVPRISLAFLSPEQSAHPMLFDHRLPLEPGKLAKVAPAVERAGIHLGVWGGRDDLYVWGTTRSIPTFCIVVEVAAPGLIVVKHHRGEEIGKFVNVAVIEGDQVKIVNQRVPTLPPDCPELLTSLLGFDSPGSWLDSVNVLVQLSVSMRAHGRGGSLLVVPEADNEWRESIVRPIPYLIEPPFTELAELRRAVPDEDPRVWQDAVEKAVEAVAGLTAVDGATIVSKDYRLLAFGAKIARRKGSPQVEQVILTEPIDGDVPQQVNPSLLGGTRHLSAAQFVHDQREAIALVASQDGRFTVFDWSPCEGMVHAHRVESLLL